MAIEDILQVTDRVTERDYNPLGDPEGVNQTEFLRFQEQMGLGQQEVMGKLIKMFKEAPSDFTATFGMEAADSIRKFLHLTTQKELQNRGQVFRDNSSEYIGQNIDYTPDQSAIGTLQTDQSENAGNLGEFFQKYKDRMAAQVGPEDELQESLQDRLNTQSLLKRIQLQDQLLKAPPADEDEKRFLIDILKDIIKQGMDTGSGIINAIVDEAKQLYREHTEKSPDYDPEFFEKEILNETTEDYYPPRP